MRFTEIDLQIEDIMWFGIDLNGYIFSCTTAGTANVPEFVCKSKEQTEFLADYFIEKLEKTTAETLETPYTDYPLMNDAVLFAQKGIFVFDAVSDHSEQYGNYTKIASPKTPIQYNVLPDKIQKLLQEHTVPVDAAKEKHICVKHAY